MNIEDLKCPCRECECFNDKCDDCKNDCLETTRITGPKIKYTDLRQLLIDRVKELKKEEKTYKNLDELGTYGKLGAIKELMRIGNLKDLEEKE